MNEYALSGPGAFNAPGFHRSDGVQEYENA
ncbi:hypothetical protein SAMN05216203_2122 [Marinobacter daqiaonensis]|uniref:Uncharacterized protein n=1 Tax=Marinobacter daqiaonensis TaxID=650891 RepID=A0A1I6ICX1_9GAMM|nr:hypothetical protein SAMN05216203_2122 [Marinobacter daqiaonensis]